MSMVVILEGKQELHKMEFLKRTFGLCKTKKPKQAESWNFLEGKIGVEWAKVPELQEPCGAIRLEGAELPERVLLVFGMDGQYHAFQNRCPSTGRRLDPVMGKEALASCSLFPSTFDYEGHVLSGPARESLTTFPVRTKKCKVIIRMDYRGKQEPSGTQSP